MFSQLTLKQKAILECEESRIVVKACPGSGKTYSVAARLAKLLLKGDFKHNGIAVISFTKVACEEIKKSLAENYGITHVGYPHFIGTIDSFVNQHLFYPFGHLIMPCSERPEIVGTEFNKWYQYDSSKTKSYQSKVSYRDPNYYFDKVSFDMNDKPIALLPPSEYHFSWDPEKMVNQNGSFNKRIKDIIDAKFDHFKQGKANQADANYFAFKLLKKYPAILQSLVSKYSHLIVDEAQDTTNIQMAIFDCLDGADIENILFVGDPNQAIFEWNTADSELFIRKYKSESYFSIDLDENRRSSSKICSLLNNMIADTSISISDVRDDENIPFVIGYDTPQEIQDAKEKFIQKCQDLGIAPEKYSIVFRGTKFGEEHFQFSGGKSIENQPWENQYFYVRDIVQGKYLIEIGAYKEGLKMLEKGFHRLIDPSLSYVSRTWLTRQVNENGFKMYRKRLFQFIDLLPPVNDKTLINWVSEINRILDTNHFPKLKVINSKANLSINQLFLETESELSADSFNIGTIHSVKGQTFDAILLFITKKAVQTNYTTILSSKQLSKKQQEELRIIYVACSRPKRLLWIAVPNEDQAIWNNYFGLTSV